MTVVKEKSLYENIISILLLTTSTFLFIIGFLSVIAESPNNISNSTILTFVLAFGLILVDRK